MKPIIIVYEPTAKARPRTKFISGHVITYNTARTVEAQEAIKALLINEMRHRKPFSEHVALKVEVTFYRTKSKWLKRSELLPFRKPDLNNFEVLINDCLSGIVFPDDAQVTCMIARKRWSSNGHGYIELKIGEDKA